MPRAGRRTFAAALLAAVAIGVVVQWPSLRAPFFDDDYVQLAWLSGLKPALLTARHTLDLYRFGDVAFFRPLTSALMVADFHLFGLNALGPHLHSLLWYVALLAVAALLFRRCLSIGGNLATLLFATSQAANVVVLWWCARHVLVSGVFGALAIWAHAGWRRGLPHAKRWMAPLALAVSLAAAEAGLQAIAYLLAFELCDGKRSRGARARTLLLLVAATAGYLILWRGLGYGVRNRMWGYVDPLAEPWSFVRTVIGERAASLRNVAAPGGVWSLLPLAAGVVLHRKRLGAIAWLLVGGLLSLPISLASPSGNVLVMPGLAASALVACVAGSALESARASAVAPARRAIEAALAAALLVAFGPLSAAGERSLVVSRVRHEQVHHQAILEARIPPSAESVALLQAPSDYQNGGVIVALYRPELRARSWRVLADEAPHTITRTGDRQLTLDGRRIDFESALDSPSLCLLVWREGVLEPMAPLALGESRTIDSMWQNRQRRRRD